MIDKDNQTEEDSDNSNNSQSPKEEMPGTGKTPEGKSTEPEKTAGSDDIKNEEKPAAAAKPEQAKRNSNYQISLINENLLKVKVTTGSGIRIDCFAKDKNSEDQSQSNRIYLHPKKQGESQEIEVIISIDSEGKLTIPEKKKDEPEPIAIEQETTGLIPNPEVADLVRKNLFEDNILTPGEDLQDNINQQNPFQKFREFYQRNLTTGIIIAIAIHLLAATIYFANAKKKGDVAEDEVQRRLIVIQELPEPKINLEDVEDPNAPQEEVKEEEKVAPKITPRNITRPPKVTRPVTSDIKPTDTTGIANENRLLDSLRKLTGGDTATARDTSGLTAYQIPDSLRKTFSENEVGLNLYFPQNWKLIDSREIDPAKKEFLGIILADTTAEEQGTMNLFINLDPGGTEYRQDQFTAEFAMEDTTLTAFFREPFIEGAFMKYYFYIFNDIGTEKLSVRADIRKQYFEDYRKEIEAVVRSIGIRKPTTLN